MRISEELEMSQLTSHPSVVSERMLSGPSGVLEALRNSDVGSVAQSQKVNLL